MSRANFESHHFESEAMCLAPSASGLWFALHLFFQRPSPTSKKDFSRFFRPRPRPRRNDGWFSRAVALMVFLEDVLVDRISTGIADSLSFCERSRCRMLHARSVLADDQTRQVPAASPFSSPLCPSAWCIPHGVTTRQAGADQLFGSYPSRADGLCLPELDHLL